VSRTALVNRLRATSGFSVVTVIAPAGYGKTTLLAQLATRDPRPFAWVSVDERDKDPVVLLRHVAAALHAIEPLEPSVFDALAAPSPSIWKTIVPRLGAALSGLDEPVVIVLDDVHLLRTRDSLEAVSALGDHLGDGSMLVVAGRTTPRLPIAALRAAGKLLEIEVEELALTPREGQLLLRGTGADLALSEVTELVRRCEGWPAALYLAALALRDDADRANRGERPLTFGADDRHLADYLRSEYLSRLRPGALRFLRRTSILRRMSGALCDAVLLDEASAHELERIERSNLFLIPLDRQRVWYRYHHLFRDLLERELIEREPALVPILHRRAADWFEARGDLETALEHAGAGGDVGRVAEIITTIALPVYYDGRVATVEAWLAPFDDPALLLRYPGLALTGSWVHALRGRPAAAERWLQFAEHGTFKGKLADGSTSLGPSISILRAALCRDGVYQMVSDAESGLAGLPPDSQLRPSGLVVLGVGYLLLGQNQRADKILASAASEALRVGATDARVVAMSERSLIASARDDPATAEAYASEANELVSASHLDGYATSAIAFAASARASLRQGHWDEARSQLADAEGVSPLSQHGLFPWLAVQTRMELARSYLALRDRSALHLLLGEIKDVLHRRPHVGVLVEEARALQREVEAMPQLAQTTKAGLTAAELRLLPFLATHHSFREIGEQLFVSRNTIKTQAISVYRKLGVSSRSDAIDRATDLGLVESSSHAA
jgi:LuxR family maltose regulon positive regulatory protein